MIKMSRYDVFEFDEPAFELTDLPSAGPISNDNGTEIAHAVSAAAAIELVGLPPLWVNRLENHIAEFGSLSVGNLRDNYEVRRTHDD